MTTAKAVYDYVDENGGKIQAITVGGEPVDIINKTVALGAAAGAGMIKTTDTAAVSDDTKVYTSAKTDALLGQVITDVTDGVTEMYNQSCT